MYICIGAHLYIHNNIHSAHTHILREQKLLLGDAINHNELFNSTIFYINLYICIILKTTFQMQTIHEGNCMPLESRSASIE